MTNIPGIIDMLLEPFQPLLASDHNRYKHHVYRIYLHALLLDNNPANEEKYAIASVFHDIGIFTKNTFNYIGPSIEQAIAFCSATGREQWREEITLMINWHHKLTPYRGLYETTVETFRKADWIDVSLGQLRFGIPAKQVRAIRNAWPWQGFHRFLVKGVAKNILKHPLNPLPMFRR